MPEAADQFDAKHYDPRTGVVDERAAAEARRAAGKPNQEASLIDVKSERAVLGSLILLGRGAKGTGLEPREFAAEENAVVFAAMRALEDKGQPHDETLLVDHLNHAGAGDDTAYSRIGGAAYLAGLAGKGTASNLSHYVNAVKERAQRRALFDIGERLQASALNGKMPHDSAAEAIAKLEGMAKPVDSGEQEMRYDDMKRKFTSLRLPTIWGLARQGEVLNVIAPPKTGKSWLVLFLALCLATGRTFLGMFKTERGKVLLVDNELHVETLTDRIDKVLVAMGLVDAEGNPVGDDGKFVGNLAVRSLRGQLKDMEQIAAMLLRDYKPGDLRAIIIDSMYKAYPEWCDENSNADITRLYTILDNVAMELNVTIIIVHHSSKGVQGDKRVTDVGSGAGAQSRSPDCHLVIREHQEPEAFVVDGVVRSWAPLQPLCVRRKFPLWERADDLDPALLKKDRGGRTRKDTTEGKAETDIPEWTVERFAAEFLGEKPTTEATIVAKAIEHKFFSERKANGWIKLAVGKGLAHQWKFGPREARQYATVQQPTIIPPAVEPVEIAPELPKKRGRKRRAK